jgi:hypothetical protein
MSRKKKGKNGTRVKKNYGGNIPFLLSAWGVRQDEKK